MKKLISALVVAASLSSGVAMAATYALTNSANNSPLHNQGLNISSWSATLTANATGSSTLIGTFLGSDQKTYNISMTLVDTYFSGGTQYWGNFSGSVTGNGRNISLNDITPARELTTDACLGLNCTSYNNHLAGGNTATLEFGFWGDDSPLAGGNRNSDVNTHVRCTSGTGSTGPANPNGTCTTGNPNPVPVPGSLALLGLGLIALGARRSKGRK